MNLKNIIADEELDAERENIVFKWNSENMFSEFKKFDMLAERADMLDKYMPLIGKLVSIDWIRKEILGQNDEQIKELDTQISKERSKLKQFQQIDNGEFGNDSQETSKETENDKDGEY